MNKIPFAKSRKTGKMMSVFDVERGLACDCVCPECGALVEACKGKIRCFFRHEKNMQESEACRNSFETSLHEMSKELIHEGISMWLKIITDSHYLLYYSNHKRKAIIERCYRL